MVTKVNFIDRLLARIDRLDRQSIQNYISALVSDRQKMERVLDEVGQGVILLSPEGAVKFANRSALLWLGFGRVPKDHFQIGELAADPLVREFIAKCLKKPFENASSEFRVLSPREMFLRLHWVPLPTEEEDEILLKIENLTQDRNVHDEEARFQRIEGLVRLASGIAHEIGNPLNAIQIHLQLLKQEISRWPKEQQRAFEKFAGVLSSETKRLDQIVRSFLKATRHPPLRFRLGSLNESIEEVANFLRPEMKKQKVAPKLLLDKNLPRFLFDESRLHEAFVNLIKNGVEAMPRGGTLTVSTVLKDKACIIQVADEGEGINEKDLPHIFEAYYTTKPEGSGLGLSQVYQAVHDHGGRIDVKSKPKKGTVFTLILPVRQERLSLPQPKENGEGRKKL